MACTFSVRLAKSACFSGLIRVLDVHRADARRQLVFMSGMDAPALHALHQISAHNQTVADRAAGKKTLK